MTRAHGTPSGYNGGCRCDACRAAHNDRQKAYAAKRKAGLADGTIQVRHGVMASYSHGCRCDQCKAKASKVNREYRARRLLRELLAEALLDEATRPDAEVSA